MIFGKKTGIKEDVKKYSKGDSLSYTLGMSLTIEALRQRPSLLEKVFLSSKAHDNAFLAELKKLCQENRVPLTVDDSVLHHLSVKENCFAIGLFRIEEEELQPGCHILLKGFADEGGLGTCLRSAVSFDQHDIALIGCTADLYDPRCVRASMGAYFHCRIRSFATLDDYRRAFLQQHCYVLHSSEGEELSSVLPQEPYSILLPGAYGAADSEKGEAFHIAIPQGRELPLPVYSALVLHQCYAKKKP